MRYERNWRLPLAVAAGVLLFAQRIDGQVTSFDDIRFWIGSGEHQAVMVVDWMETPERVPLAWGYRWDGTATGEDMFRAIVHADPRLYGRIGESGAFGVPLYGIGYDRDGDGFALTDGTLFIQGMAVTGPSDNATAVDPDDSYNEGWNTGFWAYYVSNGNPYQGGSWDSPIVGFSDRVLSHGDWDGFSFAPSFVGDPPALPDAAIRFPRKTDFVTLPNPAGVAVPEPAMLSWLIVVAGACRRIRPAQRQ